MARKKSSRPPTYMELAALIADLTEINIANLDTASSRFVKCFTHGVGHMPTHWQRAIDMRQSLIEHKFINPNARAAGKDTP